MQNSKELHKIIFMFKTHQFFQQTFLNFPQSILVYLWYSLFGTWILLLTKSSDSLPVNQKQINVFLQLFTTIFIIIPQQIAVTITLFLSSFKRSSINNKTTHWFDIERSQESSFCEHYIAFMWHLHHITSNKRLLLLNAPNKKLNYLINSTAPPINALK